MPSRLPTSFLPTLLVLAVTLGSALAAEQPTTFTDPEFRFSFQYPASWSTAPTPVADMRVKVVAPDQTPAAECSVFVKRHPKAIHAKQSEIDEIFQDAPTAAELEEVLSDDKGVVKVTKAGNGKLHNRPAHVATFHYRAEHGYASGQVAMTATPGMTWSVSCYGLGDQPEAADKHFKHWEGQIKTLFSSFRFK